LRDGWNGRYLMEGGQGPVFSFSRREDMEGAWPRTAEEFLARLIGFDTVSSRSNMALIDFAAEYLSSLGIKSEIIASEDGTKANLLATIGPEGKAGVILSGHTDVVPVEGQDWSSDPFSMLMKDGRYYGRGTADMKGFIAAVLASVPRFLESDLAVPVHLAFSYDEEVGCTGVAGMIERLAGRRPRPRLCIVGEPTEMQLVVMHKGVRDYVTRVKGREAHSSRTDKGVSAIFYAARLIRFLEELGIELAARSDPQSLAEPPYTTISVGVIEGGHAVNIIPGSCSFHWDTRLLPGLDENEVIDRFTRYAEDEVLPEMRARFKGASITTERHALAPGLAPEDGSPAEELVLSLLKTNARTGVSYATEAGHFQGIGIPTVVCGPGNILQAHRPDEYLAADQLRQCEAFLATLAARLTQPL
jgi:acetylornithine deacetylase